MVSFIRFQAVVIMVFAFLVSSSLGNFFGDVTITWGGPRAQIYNGGQTLSLSLDQNSGSGFQSNNEYMFAKLEMGIKLVPGNSAGTVTTFYLSSQGSTHDEIDFEFLGNSSGDPYTLHTNIYIGGIGNREQQFRLWFDPTIAFHTYTILWNPLNIIYMVDGHPIRVFNNYSSRGVRFPSSQPMRMYASLWDAEDWATQGGRVKTDWNLAPFRAVYQNFTPVGCVENSCNSQNQPWQSQVLDANGRNWIRYAQQKYMIYNYCTDFNRFPQGMPPECNLPRF